MITEIHVFFINTFSFSMCKTQFVVKCFNYETKKENDKKKWSTVGSKEQNLLLLIKDASISQI